MFSVKFLGKIHNSKNILDFVTKLLRTNDCKIISSSDSYELTTGKFSKENKNDDISIELTFKKTISVNIKDLSDPNLLDKYTSEIKNFYEQVKNIEDFKHLPINMRDHGHNNSKPT